jgi:5-methylthioribose kinase
MNAESPITKSPITKQLSTDEVPGYLADRPVLRELVDPDTLTVSEVGDGNLNLVFVCADAAGRRLVLKQALPYVRLVGPEWPMTEERATREAAALRAHGALSDNVC